MSKAYLFYIVFLKEKPAGPVLFGVQLFVRFVLDKVVSKTDLRITARHHQFVLPFNFCSFVSENISDFSASGKNGMNLDHYSHY